MKDKIWILKKNSYTKKPKVFNNEEALIDTLNYFSERGIIEECKVFSYSLENETSGVNYLVKKERQYKLKHTLDNSSDLENNILNLLNYIERTEFSDARVVKKMQSLRMLPNRFKSFLMTNKHKIFTLSKDVEFLYLILKVHNFRSLGQYTNKDVELKNAFNQARKKIKDG